LIDCISDTLSQGYRYTNLQSFLSFGLFAKGVAALLDEDSLCRNERLQHNLWPACQSAVSLGLADDEEFVPAFEMDAFDSDATETSAVLLS